MYFSRTRLKSLSSKQRDKSLLQRNHLNQKPEPLEQCHTPNSNQTEQNQAHPELCDMMLQFQPPKCKSAPSKMELASSDLQFFFRTTQKSPLPNLHFGGCLFAFWRLKLSWGCFIKGGTPKRLVLLGFPQC